MKDWVDIQKSAIPILSLLRYNKNHRGMLNGRSRLWNDHGMDGMPFALPLFHKGERVDEP
jgi:hypothetical protein